MNAKSIALASAVAMVLGMATVSAQAALLAYDQFDGTGGTTLTGRTANVGGTWTVASGTGALLNGTGGAHMPSDGSYGAAQAAIGISLDKSVNTAIQGKVYVGTAAWVGLAFTDGADVNWGGNENRVRVQLDNAGVVSVFLGGWNGASEGWTGGTVAGFNPLVPHTLELQLNANSRDVGVYVDGAYIAGGNYGFANGAYHTNDLSMTSASFRINGPAGSPWIAPDAYFDYVAVGATPIAIPEPASLGLLATAGLMLARRRK